MKTTREMIEIMEAFERGETIFVRIKDINKLYRNWVFTPKPVWNWDFYDYKVKSKPREIWVNEYPSGYGSVYKSEEMAIQVLNTHRGTTHHFIEVLDKD
jgi:hypothetical protein